VMLDNATYIRRELPKLQLDDALRAHTERICSGLIGTHDDIVSEVAELDALPTTTPGATEVGSYIERIVRWLSDDIAQLHELVLALEAANQRDASFGAAYVLVTESAANIVGMFNRAKAAAATARP